MNKEVRRSRRRFSKQFTQILNDMAQAIPLPIVFDPKTTQDALDKNPPSKSLDAPSLCFECRVTDCSLRGNRFGIRSCDDFSASGKVYISNETRRMMGDAKRVR